MSNTCGTCGHPGLHKTWVSRLSGFVHSEREPGRVVAVSMGRSVAMIWHVISIAELASRRVSGHRRADIDDPGSGAWLPVMLSIDMRELPNEAQACPKRAHSSGEICSRHDRQTAARPLRRHQAGGELHIDQVRFPTIRPFPGTFSFRRRLRLARRSGQDPST